MPGSRPWCPTSSQLLLAVLDTGMMFQAANVLSTTWVGVYFSQVASKIPVYTYIYIYMQFIATLPTAGWEFPQKVVRERKGIQVSDF